MEEAGKYLLNKWLVQIVRTANAEVDHVHLCSDGVVERIQKP